MMIGQYITHYKILDELGRGGMGVVYKAEDTKLKRPVAIKLLPSELTHDPEAKQRFIHEAQSTSALEHTNICSIHEIDQTDDGQLFICMSYYEGVTLKQKIEQGPLKIDDVIDLAIQITSGLTKGHAQNIIHRDIKPANIIITDDGVVKIIDYGLARLSGQTKLTQKGKTLGTVAYMSPEQTRSTEIDSRTDIWSLGVVLYEMVTGQHPFQGDYDQAVIYSILNDQPEPPTCLRTGIPMELERIINKCLEKEPEVRYQHIGDLKTDLKNLNRQLETSEIVSASAGKNRKTSRPIGKRILLNIGIVITSAIFITIMIYLSSHFFSPRSSEKEIAEQEAWENSIAVLPFADLSAKQDQEYFCDGITVQIISNLSQFSNLKVIARTSVMKYRDTHKSIPEIAYELKVAHILEGAIRRVGNRMRVTAELIHASDGYYIWAKDYDREINDIFEVQDNVSKAIANTLLQKLTPEATEKIKSRQTKSSEAYEYFLKGDYFHMIKYYRNIKMEDFRISERMFQKAIELDPNYASAYAGLADLYNTYSWRQIGKHKYSDLQQYYINQAFKLDPNSAYVNIVKGVVHSYNQEIKEQLDCLKRALSINPNDSGTNSNIAIFLRDCGLHHQSIDRFSKAIELDPLDPEQYTHRGVAYRLIGEFDKASINFQKALEIEKDQPRALNRYVRLLIIKNKYIEADSILARVESLFPDYRRNKINRAMLYAVNGDEKNALQFLEEGGYRNRYYQIVIYSLLGLKDQALKLIRNEPIAELYNIDDSDYLDMLNNPIFNILRDTDQYRTALLKANGIYKENLNKYREIF
jgi:non-specific serine/threonine protein kinase